MSAITMPTLPPPHPCDRHNVNPYGEWEPDERSTKRRARRARPTSPAGSMDEQPQREARGRRQRRSKDIVRQTISSEISGICRQSHRADRI